MAAMSVLLTAQVNVPRRIAWRVMVPKNASTRIQPRIRYESGVKCGATRSGRSGPPGLNEPRCLSVAVQLPPSDVARRHGRWIGIWRTSFA